MGTEWHTCGVFSHYKIQGGAAAGKHKEVRAGWSPKLRLSLTLAPSSGSLVQHVEVLLARSRVFFFISVEEKKYQSSDKSSFCTKIKEVRQSPLLFIFVTFNLPAATQ